MEIIAKLKDRLSQPLPGESAHNLMLPRFSSGDRVRFSNPTNPRRGAVLLMLYKGNGSFQFPLIQRPTYKGVHSGQVALPGGKQEPHDQDLYHTALRETEEEIGILPSGIEILGNLSEFFVAASNHLVLPVVGYHHSKPDFKPDYHEVIEVIEASVSELLDQNTRKEKEIITNHGYRLLSPYFDLQDRVVWGATAMMLSEFAEIMREL